jgi:hypothetical protein
MLAGAGDSGNRFNGLSASVEGSVGYFFNDNLELGVRQNLNFSDIGRPVNLIASTRLAIDFHIPLGDQNQFLPFIGANIGYTYGKNIRDTGECAPEIGIKWFVGPDVFIDGTLEYQFFWKNGSNTNLTNGQTLGDAFKNGEFVYTIGIGFRF